MHTRSCIETFFAVYINLPKQYQGLFLGGKVLENEVIYICLKLWLRPHVFLHFYHITFWFDA